ncbi:MAG TPA: 50S ribosomal protein L22 [Candidatus Hydrogenedentes bacterium]|nr:50S ribosomal protein L22 [Candidatus Hydrogenedentota bacterium]
MASAIARLRHLQIAPRKVRLVADLIRGKTVAEARDILAFTPKTCRLALTKLLASVVANAESAATERHQTIDADEMVIRAIQVNQGRMRAKYRAAARGRSVWIRARSSHVDIVIADQED